MLSVFMINIRNFLSKNERLNRCEIIKSILKWTLSDIYRDTKIKPMLS